MIKLEKIKSKSVTILPPLQRGSQNLLSLALKKKRRWGGGGGGGSRNYVIYNFYKKNQPQT